MEKKVFDVTEEEFMAYERVRVTGDFNMITQSKWAAISAGLTLERYWAVLGNYGKARELYGRVEC